MIVIKINGRFRNDKMGPIGTIARAVDHVHLGIGNCRIEGSRKTRTVVVGNKSRIRDVDIVSAIAAVPLQGIIAIILDG